MSTFIFTLTCGCYLLLGFIVFLNPRRVNIKANKWLALFLFSVAFTIIDLPLSQLKTYEHYPYLINLTNIFVFLIAPSLYFSVVYFVIPTRAFPKKNYGHFIPSLLLFILDIPTYFQAKEEKLATLKLANSTSDIVSGVVLLIVPMSIYWFLAYRKLALHQRNIQLFASSTETIDLTWLRNFLWGLAILVLIWMNEILEIVPTIVQISPILYAFSAFYLAYFVIKQEEIYPEKAQEVLDIQAIIEENEQQTIERKQLLTDEQLASLKEKLTQILENDKPYLDSTLNLPKLAKTMTLSTHELSYLINVGFEDNFFGLVNRYRVEESKRILVSPQYQHLSMVGIAFEAGFNSKTAFNMAFKKTAGVSPTEFQKLK
jgi:AraC-like DNA-binding protein